MYFQGFRVFADQYSKSLVSDDWKSTIFGWISTGIHSHYGLLGLSSSLDNYIWDQ